MLGLIGEGTGIAAKVLKSMGTYDATERGPRSDPTNLDLERASRGLIQSTNSRAFCYFCVFFEARRDTSYCPRYLFYSAECFGTTTIHGTVLLVHHYVYVLTAYTPSPPKTNPQAFP